MSYKRRFAEIWNILRITYTEDGARLWLMSRNENLDQARPADLLRRGQCARVLEAALAIEGGR